MLSVITKVSFLIRQFLEALSEDFYEIKILVEMGKQ